MAQGTVSRVQFSILFLLSFWTGDIDLSVCDLVADILPLAEFLLA